MPSQKFSATELLVLLLVSVILIAGFILLYTNLDLFLSYVREDGVVEWLTVAGLLMGCFVCVSRFIKLWGKRSFWFLAVTLILGIILFFGAGEEISWGQRMLGIKSSEFFEKNNAQHETNFHNLIVDGVKLNKLIFSLLLGIAMGIYLLIVPWLHHQNKAIRNFLNQWGVPVPQVYQVIGFITLAIITSLLKHEKNAELLECGTALLFFLIIRYPKNKEVFEIKDISPSGSR